MRILHRKFMNQDNGQGGFALVEVMVGMALFMVVMTGIMAMNNRSVQNNHLSFISTRLTNIMIEQMDTLIEMDYNHPEMSVGTHPLAGNIPVTLADFPVRAEMTWTVVQDGTAIRGTKLVVLTMFWTEGNDYTRGPFSLSFLKPEQL